MSRITNKHIIKIKELISDEVCMGTFGLVELELLEIEKDFLDQLQNTASNSDYAAAVKNLINSEVDCVQTKNGAYVNLDGVIDCINHALHGFA
ncbi:MAG TPA: hypothetical protein VLZ44_03360 [Treponemataceae bacterium]|nr:hypothetical protein [Treponemataceae bacterium]